MLAAALCHVAIMLKYRKKPQLLTQAHENSPAVSKCSQVDFCLTVEAVGLHLRLVLRSAERLVPRFSRVTCHLLSVLMYITQQLGPCSSQELEHCACLCFVFGAKRPALERGSIYTLSLPRPM